MTKAIAHTSIHVVSTLHGYRRQITLALVATSAMLVAIYAVNLYRVISHTVAIQDLGAQAAALDASVDKLDGQYVALSHAITPDAISARGFGQGKVSAFISRTASLGRIALAGHEL
jgi:hypothetical protein